MLAIDELDPELQAEEAWKETEVLSWETLSDKLRSLIGFVCDKRDDYETLTHDADTSEYDEVELRLYELKDYVDGRAQELFPDYVTTRYGYYHKPDRDRELIEYATQEGINWYALEGVYGYRRKKAIIEYLMEYRLASMKYTAALEGVKEAMKVCR